MNCLKVRSSDRLDVTNCSRNQARAPAKSAHTLPGRPQEKSPSLIASTGREPEQGKAKERFIVGNTYSLKELLLPFAALYPAGHHADS